MKKRVRNHIIDTAGEKRLRAELPDEWVIRPYQPDYGIDFEVEVFDRQRKDVICLGEHFLFQLKSHERTDWITKRV